ncbi:MAG: nitrilase family protein [Bacteroidales bacterium]|nr:nitrilase family protein [Bacteroidales bacterium]
MKVLLVQQDIVWGSPQANVKKLEALLEDAPEADLVVLPEMFTTGFSTAPGEVAEENPPVGLPWMRSFAAKHDCAVAGSIAFREGETFYNRFFFVTPGWEDHYDKRHLFKYGGEGRTFSSGNTRKVVSWRGVRFLLTVCYDLRFPVWARNRGDYDAIICVANWPVVRQLAWDTLTHARAIENQCYFLAVNRCGSDPNCNYIGHTALINPYGEDIVTCPPGEESYALGGIDMPFLQSYCSKFPVLEDEDRFTIEI